MTLSPEAERRALELLDAALEWAQGDREAFIKKQSTYADEEKTRALALLALQSEAETIQTAGGLVEAASGEEQSPPETIKSWRITGVVGRGGMGTVYRGERFVGDFEQTVAIKLVRRPAEILIDQMRQERRILARLSHPHISQLFDGGETADGRPYFVMEFVDGEPLAERLATKALAREDALSLFSKILDGLRYAHRFGVAHRDLTTANILVGSDGSLKIIDFGIGGVLGERPIDEHHVGTEGFSPPERGKPDENPTLGDVFSAGIVLRRFMEVITFERRQDLAAIAEKASASDPSERYISVQELEEDFQRYLEGRSVLARGQSPIYRLRRFSERHPRSVGGTALALFGLAAAVTTISTLYVRAEQAEAEAIERYDSVRSLARTVLFDVYDELKGIPRTDEARRLVTDIGQQYLNDLERDPRAGPELSLEIASGFRQLGQILGDTNKEPFDDPEQSAEAWANAEERLRGLLQQDPQNALALNELGIIELWKGNLEFFAREDWEKAEAHLRRAVDLLSQANGLGVKDVDSRIRFISANKTLSDLLVQSGKSDEAAAAMEEAKATSAELERTDPENLQTWRAAANIKRTIAHHQQRSGDIELSIETTSAAIRDLERMVELGADDLILLRDNALSHARRGFAFLLLDRDEESVADYQVALALTERRRAIEPTNEDADYQFAAWSAEIAIGLGRLGEVERAVAAMNIAEAFYTERYEAAPDDPRRQRTMMVHYLQLAEVYRSLEQSRERCEATRTGIRFATLMETAGTLSEADDSGIQPYRDELSVCS